MAIETVVTSKGIYFITFTCHNWLPLIDTADAYEDVYKFMEVIKKEGNNIVGYVIMPNHLHFLINYKNPSKTLNTLIGNGKRFLAYDIVRKLQQKKEYELLNHLALAVGPKDRSRGKKHEVWKPGFDVKECRTEKFLLQKLNYIHDNPVKGKWKLATDNESYVHSSCLFYFKKKHRFCEATHYDEVLDWENMYK
jgi:REP element-mobilizing transposase RayT